jgi:hypothetical protein
VREGVGREILEKKMNEVRKNNTRNLRCISQLKSYNLIYYRPKKVKTIMRYIEKILGYCN